jgi:hypothetical protein
MGPDDQNFFKSAILRLRNLSMDDKKDGFWDSVNETLKAWPSNRTTDEIEFIKSDENSQTEPRSQSAKMAIAARNKPSSRSAFNHSHNKMSTAGHAAHLPHLKPTDKPKLPTPPQKPKPVAPLGLARPVGFVPKIK